MGMLIRREAVFRMHRQPDLFLSHSHVDKAFVRQLAEDLLFCQVDAWLDEWELQVGDSLHDIIGHALERSRFIAVVIGESAAGTWANDELKQALSREKREGRTVVLPLLCGKATVPSFLEDKLYLDFRSDYYPALARLAGAIHDISRQRIEREIAEGCPTSLRTVINTLRFAGIEPYVVISEEDFEEIERAGGRVIGDRIRFDPKRVRLHPKVSHSVKRLMKKLEDEVW